MEKCTVCGKTTLLPEKLGKANICKVCFMKINGPFWKYRSYEKMSDAQKQCKFALESARKYNYPPAVLEGIETFFAGQTGNMHICDACGQSFQTLAAVGNAKMCKKCFSKIDKEEWRQTKDDYDNNEEVEENRKKILKIANKQQFPPIVIDGINAHFDKMLQKGMLFGIDGGEDQKLRVFKNYCVLITDDDFDVEKQAWKYRRARWRSRPTSMSTAVGMLGDVAKLAINGAIGGNINATINSFVDGAVNTAGKSYFSGGMFRVRSGSYRMNYKDIECVEYQSIGDYDDAVGYLRFHSAYSNAPEDDTVFLFCYDGDKVAEAYEFISEKVYLAKEKRNKQQKNQVPTPVQLSSADEILKYKELMDMGIITKKEFEVKKKALLRKE